jgi:hypothetical protein
MADTIIAMLMASASVEINILVPFSFNLAFLTHSAAFWFHTFFIAAFYGENKPANCRCPRMSSPWNAAAFPHAASRHHIRICSLRPLFGQVASIMSN